MIDFSKNGFQRTLAAGIGALLLSTTMIVAAAAPVEAAQPCLVLAADSGEQVVCSHA
jgi:hypothetical protein